MAKAALLCPYLHCNGHRAAHAARQLLPLRIQLGLQPLVAALQLRHPASQGLRLPLQLRMPCAKCGQGGDDQ